ncbi:armadillo-type protein [Zopfochytrium polystomum]|nr:armadillo-type protein [Zopfochytrium polystomum]
MDEINQLLGRSASSDTATLVPILVKIVPKTEDERKTIFSNTKLLEFLRDTLISANERLRDSPTPADIEASSTIAKIVAESAKTEDARKPIGDINFLPPLGEALVISKAIQKPESLTIQAIRALANLCFDNESNRDAILEVPGTLAALAGFLSSSNTTICQMACGAVLNISMDNEPVQQEIIKSSGLTNLLKIVKAGYDPLTREVSRPFSSTALRAVANLVESDDGIEVFVQEGGLRLLFRVLREEHEAIIAPTVDEDSFMSSLEVLEAITGILEHIAEKDHIQRAIVSDNFLQHLMDFIDHLPTFSVEAVEDEESADYTLIRRNISRVVTLVTMNDSNMIDIPNDLGVVERFKHWMTLGLRSGKEQEEDEIRMSGALCIGNLARSDESCTNLIRNLNVAPALLELLKLETDRVKTNGVKEETKSSVKVIHAVIGALKNLSLAPLDRSYLGEIGVIWPVTDLLDIDGLKPVHLGCIGILKNLCGGQKELNAYRIITGEEPPSNQAKLANLETAPAQKGKAPLNKLINHIWKSTGDNLAGVRSEGSRVIVNLVRTAHLSHAPQFIETIVQANSIAPLIQIVTGALLTRSRAAEDGQDDGSDNQHHVHFDALPAESQVFPVVQNEGLIALILIANAHPQAIPTITKYHSSLLPTAKTILESGLPQPEEGVTGDGTETSREEKLHYVDEIKVNVCLLIGTLATADAPFKEIASQALRATILRVLAQADQKSSAPRVGAAAAATVASGSPFKASAPPPITRTGTKSGKPGNSKLSEVEVVHGSASSLVAEEGLKIKDAASRLLRSL